MDVLVFDTAFTEVGIADVYDSLIWTDRYNECGDFEICTAATYDMISLLKQNYYLKLNSSEHVMIIEKIEIDSNIEEGPRLIVSGRSLESILDRRVVWKKRIFSNADFETMIHTLLDENIIAPTADTGGTDRKISNFIFAASSPAITGLDPVDAQFNSDNLYDVIKDLCISRNIGFKITLNSSNNFVFQLYKGVNRSYSQTENDFVVFSPTFDNLISSNYYYSNEKYKNAALVGGAEQENYPNLLDFEEISKIGSSNEIEGSCDSYTFTVNANGNSGVSYPIPDSYAGKYLYLSGSVSRTGTHANAIAVQLMYKISGSGSYQYTKVADYKNNAIEMSDLSFKIKENATPISLRIIASASADSSIGETMKVNSLKLYDTDDRRIYTSVANTGASGLQRREMFVDESGASQESENYLSELATKGFTELSENLESIGYEGEAEMSQQFVYGRDFAIGDIVQVDDGYGHYGSVVISEVVISENEEGLSTFPTFLSFQMEEGTN